MLYLAEGNRKNTLENFIEEMTLSTLHGEMTEYTITHWDYILLTFFNGGHEQMDLFLEAVRNRAHKYITGEQFDNVVDKVLNGEEIQTSDIKYKTKEQSELDKTTETVNELINKIEVLDTALSEMVMLAGELMRGGE